MPHDTSDLTHHVSIRAGSLIESAKIDAADAFILKYTYVKGLKAKELSAISGMSTGAIWTRLHRLRKQIPSLNEL